MERERERIAHIHTDTIRNTDGELTSFSSLLPPLNFLSCSELDSVKLGKRGREKRNGDKYNPQTGRGLTKRRRL